MFYVPLAEKRTLNREMPYGPGTFAIEASHKRWKPLPHLVLVIEFLIYLVQGKLNRLMIFMPPRHGKSELISKYFLSWYLGTFLEKRAILTSYGAGFAAKWGRETRDLLQTYGTDMFLSDVLIRNDSKASHKWDITDHKGGLITGGAGGPIMGEGANLFIIDDPHKNPAEASSPTYQAKIWEWYLNVALQRVERDLFDGMPGSMVYIAQRLDVMDLAGQILKAEPHINASEALQILRNGGSIPEDTWVVLNLPLLAEENDILGRAKGEPLWPARVNKAKALRLKKTMGTFRFNAVEQGDPQDREGEMFKEKWFKKVKKQDIPLNKLDFLRYWDLAGTDHEDNKQSAYTVGELWGRERGMRPGFENYYLLNVIRKQLSPFKVKALVQRTAKADGRNVRVVMEQEGAQSGKFQVAAYTEGLSGYVFRPDRVRMSKEMRAEHLEIKAEGGFIHVLDEYWTDDFVTELVKFPHGHWKDQVDAASGAIINLRPRASVNV